MKKLVTIAFLFIIFITNNFGQYGEHGIVFSAGTNYSKYLGHGEGDNYFKVENPGFQLEFSINGQDGFEWIIWGVEYSKAYNIVGKSRVPVTFWSPYYTEFLFYQQTKKNPLFWFFGYEYMRMKFPDMEKPDSHHNITFGGGWNLKVTNHLFMQFKLKPYFVIDNSIGQWFGCNAMVNLHLGVL